jgi:Na+-driven multidrug efflux pump
MIGTNIGAGRRDRALRVAWTTVLLAGLTAETVGLAAAAWPDVWIGAFSTDPGVVAAGSDYLRTVGPMFGFFGIGYAMYCVGQGTGGMRWPVAGACVRAALAVLGGLACLQGQAGVHWIFLSVAVGMASFGCLALPGLVRQSGFGISERATKQPAE